MKTIKFFLMAMVAIFSTTVFAQDKTASFKVSGNCSMCKKTIETAAKNAGVNTINWDAKTQLAKVTFELSKVSEDTIQKKIAEAGYDTQRFKAIKGAYEALPSCCQYERETETISSPAKHH